MLPAIFVIEIEEVLVAKIACSGVTAARCPKMAFFNRKSSEAASIAKSTFDMCWIVSPKLIRLKTSYFALSVIRSLLISLSHHLAIAASLFFKDASLGSTKTTFTAATLLATIPIPVPIYPAPTIPICLIPSMLVF